MDIGFGQWRGAAHQIILMAAKSRAGIVVDVVADETDLPFQMHGLDGLHKEGVAGRIIAQHVEQAHALRGAVFEMAHVDVTAAAVEKKTAVASRFVPIALMHVDQAETMFPENPVAHPGNGGGRAGKIARQASVLRLQTDDAIHNPRSEMVKA